MLFCTCACLLLMLLQSRALSGNSFEFSESHVKSSKGCPYNRVQHMPTKVLLSAREMTYPRHSRAVRRMPRSHWKKAYGNVQTRLIQPSGSMEERLAN